MSATNKAACRNGVLEQVGFAADAIAIGQRNYVNSRIDEVRRFEAVICESESDEQSQLLPFRAPPRNQWIASRDALSSRAAPLCADSVCSHYGFVHGPGKKREAHFWAVLR